MTQQIKVETNVRYPIEKFIPCRPRPKGGRPMKYPWKELSVGDSFLVRCDDYTSLEVGRCWNKMTSSKANASKTTGFKFVMRRVPGGLRIWRSS